MQHSYPDYLDEIAFTFSIYTFTFAKSVFFDALRLYFHLHIKLLHFLFQFTFNLSSKFCTFRKLQNLLKQTLRIL